MNRWMLDDADSTTPRFFPSVVRQPTHAPTRKGVPLVLNRTTDRANERTRRVASRQRKTKPNLCRHRSRAPASRRALKLKFPSVRAFSRVRGRRWGGSILSYLVFYIWVIRLLSTSVGSVIKSLRLIHSSMKKDRAISMEIFFFISRVRGKKIGEILFARFVDFKSY